MDDVSIDANWRQRLKTEERTAKSAEGEWGFLSGKHDLADPAKSKGHNATCAAKYYGGSGAWTVRQKMLPNLETELADKPIEAEEDFPSPTGHRTARSATLLSHSMRLEDINNSNVLYTTSSKCYGQRLPIEQFGVAHHGLQCTAITRQ